MAISVTQDLYNPAGILASVLGDLNDPYKTAAAQALDLAPMDRLHRGYETLYAAVVQDTTLTGAALIAVATACAQFAYPVAYYNFWGSGQRATAVVAAMNAVVSGTAPSALTSPPAVDSAFTSFATPPDPATVLANAKGAQSAQLQAAYQAAILAPVSFTTAAGATANFAQDATAKANLQDALAGSEKSSAWALNLWLDVNGATVTPFTYGDLQGLAAAMEAYDVPKYSELLALLAQVNSATTPAAVNAVVWS